MQKMNAQTEDLLNTIWAHLPNSHVQNWIVFNHIHIVHGRYEINEAMFALCGHNIAGNAN